MLKEYIWDLLINGFCGSWIVPYQIRRFIFRSMGMKVSNSSAIHAKCYFSGKLFSIGKESYINRKCIIDSKAAAISIGNKVGIAYGTQILTTSHDFSDAEKRTGSVMASSVVIEDGVWVGAGAIICPGVTIKSGAVIASGSVVTQSCEKNTLYAGIPATCKRRLEENE